MPWPDVLGNMHAEIRILGQHGGAIEQFSRLQLADARIVADPRHLDTELLAYESIVERRFAGWSMGQVQLSRMNPAMLLKYSATAALDPFALPGAVSMALLDELVATASIVGQP